jgi:integrase
MQRFSPHLPYEDFPLFPHATGRWAKKIRGTLRYFGYVRDGWEPAFEKYEAEAPYLNAGKTPPTDPDGLTVARLCDHFYEAKRRKVDAGEMTARTLAEYDATAKELVAAFGRRRLVTDLTAGDFGKLRAEFAEHRGPVTLGNAIQRVRTIFKFAFDNGHIDRPIRMGSAFAKPSAKVLRKHRAAQPKKLFAPAEIHTLMGAATKPLRAMILLGVNCGMGNSDVAELTFDALDLDAGTLDFPRPKTGVARRAVLWGETVAAIHEYLAERPQPANKADAKRVFISRRFKTAWIRYRDDSKRGVRDLVSKEFQNLKDSVGINTAGRNFYSLRHTFRTVADSVGDRTAVDLVMGHEASRDIATHYIESVDDDRLRKVAQHVHGWLYNA